MTFKTDEANCVFVVILDGDLVQTPEHLGVSYLISVLRHDGYHCTLVDVSPGEETDAVAQVSALAPRFVGISLTTVNLPRASQLGHALRAELGPDVHICAGGPIATFMGRRLLEQPEWSFLDSLVRGEAEGIISSLINAVLSGEAVHTIPGVAVRDCPQRGMSVVAVDDLDTLPWPARDQLEARSERLTYVRISTSRGCTSHCTFCNAPHARNNLARRKIWRGRRPDDVVDEIEFLSTRYDVHTFDFVDSTFEDPSGEIGKRRVRRIAELILERGLRIYYNICCQAKNWTEDDVELLSLLHRSGLEKVLIGIESGSDRVLRVFKKRSTTEDNRRAIQLFRQQGVYVAFGFIMFQPYADWQDIEANANFLVENLGHNLRRFVTRLELYPGAEAVQQLATDNLLEPDYWRTLNPYAYRYTNPDIGRMAEMINGLFGKDYVKRGRIAQEPSVFAFDTFDITLHTYVSRLLRKHGNDPVARAIIDEHIAMIDTQKVALTNFNAALFNDILIRAKTARRLPIHLAETVEYRYAEAMERIKSIQLRLGMNLRRKGIQPFATEGSAHV